jgi:protein-tyrosine phosphatase
MNKICDRVYLGNLQAAQDIRVLKEAGITHILQVASGLKPAFSKDFTYKVINVNDTSSSSLIRHFPAAIAFMKEGVAKGGVLVHCYAGVSRSATCVIAYLMQTKNLAFQTAFQFASRARPVIFPNMGFQKQL